MSSKKKSKNNDNEESIIVEQQSSFEKLRNDLYFTFTEILECKSISPQYAIFLVVFQYLQMISLTANSKNTDLDSSLIGTILPLIEYTLMFPSLTNQTNLFFNYGMLSIGLGVSVFLVWGIYYINNAPNQEEVYIRAFKSSFGLLYDTFDKVIFLPVIGLTLSNFFCKLSITCYSMEHIILIGMSVVIFILMLALDLIYVYFFFNFTFKSTDSLSRNPSTINFSFYLFRLISLLAYLILDISDSTNLLELVLVQIVISSIFMYDSLTTYTFHNKSVSKTNCIMVTTFFWVNISSFFLLASGIDLFKQNALIVVGLGSIFFVRLQLNIISFTANSIMIKDLVDINTDMLLDMKVRIYHTLSQTLHLKKSELLLASLLKIHHDKCDESMCPCQRRNSLYDPKKLNYGDSKIQFHKDDVFVKHFINKIIKDGLKKFKMSKLTNLNHLFFQFESLSLYTPLSSQIYLFRKMYGDNIDVSTDFILYTLNHKLKKFLLYKNSKNPVSEALEVENVKQFDRGLKKIRDSIRQVAQLFADLWETLSDQIPDLAKLLQVCNKNFTEIGVTSDIFQFLISLNNTSIELKILMEIYANQVVYDELLNLQVQKSIHMRSDLEVGNSISQDLDFLIKKYNIYDDKTCVVSLSSKYDSMSQISWCSQNVENVLGINASSLKGRSLNDFMPGVFSSFHDQILKQFYNTGQETTINNIIHTWAVDHQGFCFSANVFAKIIPINQDYEIMGLIHRLNAMDYIITDQDGEISGIGNKFSSLIGIQPKEFLKYRLNIQLIAPKLMSVYKDYFIEFEDQASLKRPIQGLQSLSVLGSDQKTVMTEIKFILFIPQDFKDIMKDHLEKKETMNQAFFQPNEDILRQKALLDSKNLLEFKSLYFNYLQYGLKKINWKKLDLIIKVRATALDFSFFNGINMTSIKALKILHYEVKKPDYDYMQKMKKRQGDIKGFIFEMNKLIDDQKKKKIKNFRDEQKNQVIVAGGENKANDDGTAEKRKQQYKKRLKNVLSLFQRQISSSNSFNPQKSLVAQVLNTNLNTSGQRDPARQSQIPSPSSLNVPVGSILAIQLASKTLLQEEKIDQEVRKVIIGLMRPPQNYAQHLIRRARILSKSFTELSSSNEDQNEMIIFQRKQYAQKTYQESGQQQSQLVKLASKVDDFSKQTSSVANNIKLPVPTAADKRSKMKNQQRTKSNEVQFPDYDENLVMPACSRIKEAMIRKKMIGKRKYSYFFQVEEKSEKVESGLMFDFEDKTKQQEEQQFQQQIQQHQQQQQQASHQKLEINNDERRGSLRKNVFDKQTSIKLSNDGTKSDFKKQSSLSSNMQKEDDKKKKKLPLMINNNSNNNISNLNPGGINKLRNKMKNGSLIKQLKQLKKTDGNGNSNPNDQFIKNGSDTSTEEDVDADELKILLKSEKSMGSAVKEERNLLNNLDKKDVQEEEKAVAQSVNSVGSSINTQNALRLLRVSLQNMRLPFVLVSANYLVIVMSLTVFGLSLSQLLTTQSSYSDIKQQIRLIDNVSAYSENTTNFYSLYSDFNYLQNTYYDASTHDAVWRVDLQKSIDKYSRNFINFSINDLSESGKVEIRGDDIRFYFFSQMKVVMLIDQIPQNIELNYEKYIRLLSNAVNNTIYFPATKFQDANLNQDDLLYFIFSNYDIGIVQNSKNYAEAESLIENSISYLTTTFISQWTFSFVAILLCLVVIYPIIMQSRIKIHDSLVLFTKISIRDVENYFAHYKNMTHFFQSFTSIRQLVKDMESYLEGEQHFLVKQKKEADSRAISRSRHYKGVKIDKIGFFFQMLGVFVFFTAFILVKDIKMIQFILDTDNYVKAHIVQQQVFYDFQKREIAYKRLLCNFIKQENTPQLTEDSNILTNLLSSNITEILMNNLKLFRDLNDEYKTFVEALMTDSICKGILNVLSLSIYSIIYFTYQHSQLDASDQCFQYQKSILTKSYQNFYVNSENIFRSGFSHLINIYQSSGYTTAKVEALKSLNDDYIKDLRHMREYIQLSNLLWKDAEQSALFGGIDSEILFTEIFVIIFSVALFLFVILIWMSIFIKLKRDSRWVNGFILLIPIQMLRENQYLRSYLKRKLQINSLNYA